MNNYVNGNNVDSNMYYLDKYMSEYDEVPTHEYEVTADVYYWENEDDDECQMITLEGTFECREGFVKEDIDDLSLTDQLEILGFCKQGETCPYDVADIEWYY